MDDPLWNDAMGLQVMERYELWSGVRRAEVMQQVRKIMRDKGISNLDLAKRLKVSEPAMSRMLKGDQNVKLDTLYRIADALDEPLHITFGVAEKPEIEGMVNLSLPFILDQLRLKRDKTTGDVRHAYNEVCDRLDVLISRIAESK